MNWEFRLEGLDTAWDGYIQLLLSEAEEVLSYESTRI
jgi:hypothetical protein